MPKRKSLESKKDPLVSLCRVKSSLRELLHARAKQEDRPYTRVIIKALENYLASPVVK